MREKVGKGLAILALALTAGTVTAGTAAATPLRYYDTFYGENAWYSCLQRGYRSISNGEWYDSQCRAGNGWVDLYIQVAP